MLCSDWSHLICFKSGSHPAVVNDLRGHEVELDVGMLHTWVTPDEASCLKMGCGGGSCSLQKPFNANLSIESLDMTMWELTQLTLIILRPFCSL